MADKTLSFDIVARDKASDAFKSAAKGSDGFSGSLKGLAGVAAGGLGAVAVANFAKGSIKAFTEADASQHKLQDAFARFPKLADTTIGSLQKLNTGLEAKTKFDDDATASGQAVLAQFGLTGKQIRQITPLLQDYAAKTGKDLPEAADVLGKALLGKGKALAAIGIKFKDAGSVGANFEQVVSGLSEKVGGFAEKEGKTAAGRAEILKNQFGELQETVGKALVPALTKMATILATAIAAFVSAPGPVKVLIIGIAALSAGLLILSHVQKVVTAVQALFAQGTIASTIATKVAAVASKAWAAAQWLLNAALDANPIGLIVIAVAALIGGLILAYKHSQTFRDIVQSAFAVVSGAVSAAIGVFEAIGHTVMRVLGGAIEWLKNNWQTVIVGLLTGGLGLVVLYVVKHFDDIVGFVTGLPGRIAGAAKGMWDGIVDALRGVLVTLIGLWNKIDIKIKIPDIPGVPHRGETIDLFPDIPVPKFHSGLERVPGRAGQEMLALLTAGERVLNPTQAAAYDGGGAGGVRIGTYSPVFHGRMDEDKSARATVRELRKLAFLGA